MEPEHSMDIDVDIDWPVAEQRILRWEDISDCIWRGHGVHPHQRNHKNQKLQKDDVEVGSSSCMNILDDLCVLLLTSSEDPVAQLLADKLKKLTGCEVMQVTLLALTEHSRFQKEKAKSQMKQDRIDRTNF
uniref:Cytidine monophosphate N-acetylneuraminic acid synthetase a n=1 Tax=Nothobranchius rachovii TaxID=451742 RepID=A0A1A8QXH7_9TELE